jgi:hypothetical protein
VDREPVLLAVLIGNLVDNAVRYWQSGLSLGAVKG